MSRLFVLLILGVVTAWSFSTRSLGQEPAQAFDPYKHPDPYVTAFYEEHRDRIAELTAEVKDSTRSSTDRVAALQELRDEYPDVALPIIAESIKSDDEALAGRAAQLMASASMMMNHRQQGDSEAHKDNPVRAYAMAEHTLIYQSLRQAVRDKRQSVYSSAAKTLASQSDQEGLRLLKEGRDQGILKNPAYVSLLSLADPDQAGEYLQEFLNSDDAELQAAAGRCLSQSAKYAPQVNSQILFNDSAPLKSRLEVARYITDVKDLMPLLVSPKTPGGLYSEVVKTYVDRKGESLTGKEAELLQEGLKNHRDEGDHFKELIQRLDSKLEQLDNR